MKLFYVWQNENGGYDTYSDFVVCAPDEETARDTHPNGRPVDWDNVDRYDTWALRREAVKVEYIGEAAPHLEVGIVCASFHAG